MTDVLLGSRGTSLFSADELARIVHETVEPELDASHSIVGVGTVTASGIKTALVFQKHMRLGYWRLEAAFESDWHGDTSVGAKILFKL